MTERSPNERLPNERSKGERPWGAARRAVGTLRERHGRHAGRFAIVGVLNTALDLALFNGLHYGLGLALVLANTLSYAAGIAQSFVLNRHWTFADRRDSGRRVGPQLALFVALNLVALGLSNLTIWLLVRRLAIPAYAAKLVAVGVTFVWGYATSRRFVFHPR